MEQSDGMQLEMTTWKKTWYIPEAAKQNFAKTIQLICAQYTCQPLFTILHYNRLEHLSYKLWAAIANLSFVFRYEWLLSYIDHKRAY